MAITDDELAALVRDAAEAADAFIRGDTDRYLELVHHAPGFTLFRPYGGPATRSQSRAPVVRESAGYFQHGQATLENVETHAWDDTVVIAMVERQHGEVGGTPDQDWSLRVTHVYRRDGDRWLLVHRHADALVRPIDLAVLGSLARGELAPGA